MRGRGERFWGGRGWRLLLGERGMVLDWELMSVVIPFALSGFWTFWRLTALRICFGVYQSGCLESLQLDLFGYLVSDGVWTWDLGPT